MKTFVEDFNSIWSLIESGKNFAFSRYADGEIALIKGRPISSGTQAADIDRWTAPASLTKLGEDLEKTLSHTEGNYYYAISCDCCDPIGKDYLLSKIKQRKELITYSNLWINGNYFRFINKFFGLRGKIHVLANRDGVRNAKFPFPIASYMAFGNNCVEVWRDASDEIKLSLKEAYSQEKGSLFLISVGPMSEVIIDYLYSINPENQYIDVGSAIDEFTHGRKTRHYMDSNSPYNTQICNLTL